MYLFILIGLFKQQVWSQGITLFNNIGQEQGLSNGSVTSIIQERDGFFWIGTKNGLNRYDGSEFKVYTKSNSRLCSNDITDLIIDNQNRLWVATLGGLNLYNVQLDAFEVFKYEPGNVNSISSNIIQSLYQDSKGRIWIGTENGVNVYEEGKGTFKSFNHQKADPYSLSNNSVRSVAEDNLGNLWVGTFGGGLNKFDESREAFEHVRSNDLDISIDFIYALSAYNEAYLLIGTGGSGLVKMDLENHSISQFFDDEHKQYRNAKVVRNIEMTDEGVLLVGTDGQGVLSIKLRNTQLIVNNFLNNDKISKSLVSNAIYSIYEDVNANLWIGTAWNGISILEHKKSNIDLFFSDLSGKNSAPVLSVFKDEEHLLIGTDGKGMNQWNSFENEVNVLRQSCSVSLPSDYIQVIHKSKDNEYWIGTYADGLMECDANLKLKMAYQYSTDNEDGLSYNDIRDIVEDEDGNLWIATWGGGLNYFDRRNQVFTTYKYDEGDSSSISSNNVLDILEAGNNKLWVATFGGGLNLFDKLTRKFTRFQFSENKNSPCTDNLLSILKDSSGNLWIGTWMFGLNKYDPSKQRFEHFDQSDGLSDNTVTAILEDDQHNLWLSTKKGISKFDARNETFSVFPAFTSLEFHINSSFKDEEGKLYFGGLDGLALINPSISDKAEGTIPVNFTGFKLFNEPIQIGKGGLNKHIQYEDQIVLEHDQDVITFEFAALRFPSSESCEYYIKMENFDKGWRGIGQQRSATFTNLSPGEYTFKVRAETGEQKSSVQSVNLVVLKPIWLTWWAFGAYAVVFLTVLYLVLWYTISWQKLKSNFRFEKLTREKEKELSEVKLRFFTNISHEIRTPVTLIIGAVNRILEGGLIEKKYREPAAVINKNSDHLLQLVDELLDFRKLESGGIQLKICEHNLGSFIKEIFISFSTKAANNNIKYDLLIESDEINIWMDGVQIEKVIYNLLSNAFKFTPKGGSVRVALKQDDQYAYLSIEDSGAGIERERVGQIFDRFYQSDNLIADIESGYGIGLSITKEIVKLHSGDIGVESFKEKGAIFTIKLPLGNDHFSASQLVQPPDHILDPGELVDDQAVPDFVLKETARDESHEASVLIVEDNEQLRKYLVGLFESHCHVLESTNGLEGTEMAFEHLPDLIISDVMMPEMDGIALTNKLKLDIRTSHIPIILLTARTSLIYKNEGFETGADDYITKPFNESLLKTRVKNLLRNRQLLRDKFKNESLIEPKELAISNPDQEFLMALTQVIEENIGENELKASFLTKELGMSHSVIYKKVKALTGQSLVEFIRDFKLKRAEQFMIQQHYSVTEACYKIGFSDRRYFSNIFKKKFGVNPSDYIRNHFGT